MSGSVRNADRQVNRVSIKSQRIRLEPLCALRPLAPWAHAVSNQVQVTELSGQPVRSHKSYSALLHPADISLAGSRIPEKWGHHSRRNHGTADILSFHSILNLNLNLISLGMISTVLWVTSGSKQGKSVLLAYYINDLFWTRKSFTVASVVFGDPEHTAYMKAIELVCMCSYVPSVQSE